MIPEQRPCLTPISETSSLCQSCAQLGPMPTAPLPPGKMYIHTWSIVDATITPQESTPVSSSSFENLWLDKLNPKSKEGKKPNRRKIDFRAHVITGDAFHNKIIEKENEKKGKEKEKEMKKAEKEIKKVEKERKKIDSKKGAVGHGKKISNEKMLQLMKRNDGVSSEDELSDDDQLDEIQTTNFTNRTEEATFLKEEMSAIESALDDDKKGFFYATFYDQKYFWGKDQNVFSEDSDSNATHTEMKFLRYRADGFWDFPTVDDIDIVQVKFLYLGPCTPSETVNGKGYRFIEDDEASKRHKLLRKT